MTMRLEREGMCALAVVLDDGERLVIPKAQVTTYMPGASDWSGARGYWSEASLQRDGDVLVVHVVDVTDHEGGIDRQTTGVFRSVDGGRVWTSEVASTPPAAPAIAVLSTHASTLPVVGDYRLIRRVGAGSAGELYEAFDPNTEHVALRLLRDHDGGGVRERVLALKEMLPQVRHRNLVGVRAIAMLPDGRLLVATDLVRDRTLQRALAKAPLAPSHARKIACDMLSGVEALHASGIIHGDIRPANVFFVGVDPADPLPAALADAGLLLAIEDGIRTRGSIRTDIAYLPPEGLETLRLDRLADVYGVGVCLYEMLAEERPFSAESTIGILSKILAAEPRPLRSFTGAPADLAAIVERAVARDPAARFPSATAMREALASCDVAGGLPSG